MPLTREQFNNARAAGFSIEQITGFEKQRATTQSKGFFQTMGDNLARSYRNGPGALMSSMNDLSSIPGQVSSLVGGPEFPGIKGALPKNVGDAVFPEQDTIEGKGLRFVGVGGAIPVMKTVKVLNSLRPTTQIKLAERIQAVLPKADQRVQESFGKIIDSLDKLKPGTKIDLSDVAKQVGVSSAFSNSLKSTIRKSDILKRYVKNPELAKDLSLRESQNLLNDINTSISKGARSGNVDSNELPIQDLLSTIKNRQATPFPEIVPERAKFAATQKAIENLKSSTTYKNTLQNAGSKFGSPQLEQIFKNVAKTEDPGLIGNIKNYRAAQFLKRAALVGGGLIGANAIKNQLYGN